MQKFVCLEVHPGAKFDKINSLLEDGWKVVEIHSTKPTQGDNMCALVLIEKENQPPQTRQKE